MYLIDSLILIRHGESTYNKHRTELKKNPLYLEFLDKLAKEQTDGKVFKDITARLVEMNREFRDNKTIPLSNEGKLQATATASKLKTLVELPEVIFVSPFRRTLETLDNMIEGWPELGTIPTIPDDRLEEQKHGKFLEYGDWRLFCHFNPEQRKLRKDQGVYFYKFPDGESIEDVQMRTKLFLVDSDKKYNGKKVLIVSHNIAIQTIRANIENLKPDEVGGQNLKNESVNCGVTMYKSGVLQVFDNSKLY